MDKANLFFESYNMTVEESYDSFFEISGTLDPSKVKDEELTSYIESQLASWAQTPLTELDGMTPYEYVKGHSSLEQLLDLFKEGASLCDMDMPAILVERMQAYGESAPDALLELALCKETLDKDELDYKKLMSIKVLGSWQTSKAVLPFLDLLSQVDEKEDLLIETILDALVDIGEPGIEALVSYLNDAAVFTSIHEQVTYALVKVSASRKQDAIYLCIKNAFNKMKDKIIGAICLRDYGDSRAIPSLRGYAAKNISTMDYPTFCEIHAAVRHLGGSMDDIQFPKSKAK